jgi:hypothetical protein
METLNHVFQWLLAAVFAFGFFGLLTAIYFLVGDYDFVRSRSKDECKKGTRTTKR